jgi:hypothetical protein
VNETGSNGVNRNRRNAWFKNQWRTQQLDDSLSLLSSFFFFFFFLFFGSSNKKISFVFSLPRYYVRSSRRIVFQCRRMCVHLGASNNAASHIRRATPGPAILFPPLFPPSHSLVGNIKLTAGQFNALLLLDIAQPEPIAALLLLYIRLMRANKR